MAADAEAAAATENIGHRFLQKAGVLDCGAPVELEGLVEEIGALGLKLPEHRPDPA